MVGEQSLEDEIGRRLLRVVFHLVEFLENDLLLFVDLGLADLEVEEDVLLVAERELGVFRGKGDLEDREVLTGVRVEIGAVPPDVGADLLARAMGRSPEENAMFEEMDEPACRVGLVLGTDVEGRDDIQEGEFVLLVEKDAEAVVENEGTVRRLGRNGRRRAQANEDAPGRQKDGPPRHDPGIRGHGFSLQQIPCQFSIWAPGAPAVRSLYLRAFP
jgi:hypothetical protein